MGKCNRWALRRKPMPPMGYPGTAIGMAHDRLFSCRNKTTMNAKDAILFALLGAAMEVVPRAFPGWFPHSAGGAGNASAAWLMVMGAVQFAIGAGVLAGMAAVSGRLQALVQGRAHDGLAVPAPRAVGR